ncbi:cupin domain-containing protein [Lysobacter arvi]|uniref:Cupin domain-containing protein n=1 Tax=Lysobacter arvi TaxID=3038776 RepID=A0ABU1C9Y9_9GAMM|nr:cupin domain-containing protein [Lysobacter arvi]MDR0182008.1 cupin domain-containing protein [Lysobacter arvi]
MRTTLAFALAAVVWSGNLCAQATHAPAATAAQKSPTPIATPVMTKPLPEFPGKEAQMALIEYPPGAVAQLHHHDAHVFVYVLEGSLVMGLKGSPEVNLSSGDSWYEGPQDIHTVGRNASPTAPAKFVVFFLKDAGKPAVIPGE